MSQTPKSYEKHNNPIVDYCASHTVIQSPLQKELFKITLEKVPMAIMMGAPEVLTFGENFIRNFNHKKVLDVGTFTGCSALAWAQALPDDGEVYTFDIDLKNYNTFGVPILSKCQKTFSKIKAIEGEALKSLEKLIESGHSDTFDFAFIDADKGNYPNYYDRCVKLLKKGGVIFVDNSLRNGSVCQESTRTDEASKAIHAMNDIIFNDDRTYSALLNLADGIHVAFKR